MAWTNVLYVYTFISVIVHQVLAQQVCFGDIGFVLDSSGSMGDAGWNTTLHFVQKFAEHIGYGMYDASRIGVVKYGNSAIDEIHLNQYPNYDDFYKSVGNMAFMDQRTNTADGLRKLHQNIFQSSLGDRNGVTNVGILLSDGASTVEPDQTIFEATLNLQQGIKLVAIGIGNNVNNTELESITGDPSLVKYVNFMSLQDDSIYHEIIGVVCSLIEPQLEPEAPSNFQEAFQEETDQTCVDNHDIMFVLDSSGSMGHVVWEKVTEFVQEFIRFTSIGPQDSQIGVITYSNESYLDIALNTYQNSGDLIRAVGDLKWHQAMTNTASALKMIAEEAFVFRNGDRYKSDNVAIFITDGFSNSDVTLMGIYADLIHKLGVRTYVLVIGTGLEMPNLDLVASKPQQEHQFILNDVDNLDVALIEISKHICSVADPVEENSFEDSCRSDIVFVIDGVGQLSLDDWDDYKQFIKDLVTDMDVGAHGARLGFVAYSGTWNIGLDENLVDQKDGFITTVSQLPYRSWHLRNLAYELEFTRTHAFDTKHGDRKHDPNVAVVLIDDSSSITTEAIEAARKMKEDDITVFVIMVGNGDLQREVEILASEPYSEFIAHASDFSKMHEIHDFALSGVCFFTSAVDWSCNFDDSEMGADMCEIIQDQNDSDMYDWVLHSGRTPSLLTGPEQAFDGQYYLYLEASHRLPGDKANIFLPVGADDEGYYCLLFHAHLYGFHIDALQVIVRDTTSGVDHIRWTTSGRPDGVNESMDVWRQYHVSLLLTRSDEVGFSGVRGDGYAGDIALDQIRFSRGECPDLSP